MNSVNDFGLFLKSEREQRGIPLEEIANTTKIHMRFLSALENNDYSEFPGDVFIKGYIRSYANAIGSNVESVLIAYEDSIGRQRNEDYQKVKSEQDRILNSKIAFRRNIFVGIFLVVFAVAGYYLSDIYKAITKSASTKSGESSTLPPKDTAENTAIEKLGDIPAAIKPEEAELTANALPTPESLPEESKETRPTGDVENNKAPIAPASTAVSASTAPAVPKTEEAPAKPAKQEDQNRVAPVSSNDDKHAQTSVEDAKKSEASPKAEKEEKPLRLVLKSSENSWFTVTVDGGRKIEFILAPGASKSISAKNSFKVTIGNKNGAELALNGHSLALPSSDDNVIRDFQITPKLIE